MIIAYEQLYTILIVSSSDSQKILSKAYQKNKSMKRNSLGDDDSMKIKMVTVKEIYT